MPLTSTPDIVIGPVDSRETFSFLHLDDLKAELSIDFKDHDVRLKRLLQGACERIESLTGLFLVKRQVTVSWTALYDWEDLPWGPIVGDVLITDVNRQVISPQLTGTDFRRLTGNYPDGLIAQYVAGYDDDTLPSDLLDSAIFLAANNFDGGNRDWRGAVFMHRQGSFIQ